MENFFNWMVKPVPEDEVVIWFNINNMHYEKIELFGDIFKSLYMIINETYLGDETSETKIILSNEDKKNHFDWCWNKMIENFKKENVIINPNGKHKDYLESFYVETFYSPTDKLKESIPSFLTQIFDINIPFSKSDLEILTELYKLLEKNIE
jgi:hypothetical protein